MMGKARSVADLEQGVVLARVEIAAAPERVFRALTTEELAKWWGADGMYRTTKCAMETRAGGRWRSDGMGGDGKPFHVEGEVVEIDPPRKLVHTWKPSWTTDAPTTVAYTLDSIPGGTRVTVRHSGFAPGSASCESHGEGWERVLGWLGGHVAPEERFFLLRLIAPRPTFAMDMTADERAIMEKHGVYWRGKLAAGVAIAFGPVLDPKGPWGMGLVKAHDEAEVAAFEAGDPAITSGRGFRYEVLPMLRLVH